MLIKIKLMGVYYCNNPNNKVKKQYALNIKVVLYRVLRSDAL